jgi:hypothetical protein
MEPPNTRNEELENEHAKELKNLETKNLWKPIFSSKVVNSFSRALGPPFIGRWRDFYIPKFPSDLKNIPNGNMYMNVFYIL